MALLRLLVTVAAMSLLGTSANAAMTMEECKAQYKAEHTDKKPVGLTWVDYQAKRCGIDPKASAPTSKPAAPVKH